jgi:ribosomal protein L28
MTELEEWITPKEAARLMGDLAGYRISQDDIRQLKRTGKITKVLKLSDRITLYNLEEIRTVKPPNKRKKVLIDTQPMRAIDKEAA